LCAPIESDTTTRYNRLTHTAALVLASSAFAEAQLRGKILGVFVRNPYDGTIDTAGLKRYISTSNVWCAWSNDGHVIVHVTMRNRSAEHGPHRGGAASVHGDSCWGGTRGLRVETTSFSTRST
jgi:hypothetical protein